MGTVAFGVSCTNLDEEILDGYTNASGVGGDVNTGNFLQSAYEGLRTFQGQGGLFTMEEMSTDALVGPTRGSDWDDNAKWRQFHVHTWGADNEEIRNGYNGLLTQVYNCDLVINNTATDAQKVEARFLRAFYYYNVVDLFGQAPYREAGSPITDDPKFWTRKEATAFIISELEAVLPKLSARVANDASIANKDACNFLLAKLYLNKAVFNAASPAGPYTFDAADMNKVIAHVDAISSSLQTDYWSNFAPTNNTSNEILFSSKNVIGTGGDIQSRWRMGMHYNQTPDGWNGFATVAEYYNRFGATDDRRQHSTPSIITNFGNPIGFQIGQMYGPEGDYKTNKDGTKSPMTPDDYKNKVPFVHYLGGVVTLNDRNGKPLIFTPAVALVISDPTAIETAGIRTQKYEPDSANLSNPANDYVLMRYSDALLMKAEAALRGGTGGAAIAKTIIDQIDVRAKLAPGTTPATLDGVYLERGKELWFEGWRRNDMIRFGKFLAARELKPAVSNSKFLLYPIPADALFNPNVRQNPGY